MATVVSLSESVETVVGRPLVGGGGGKDNHGGKGKKTEELHGE